MKFYVAYYNTKESLYIGTLTPIVLTKDNDKILFDEYDTDNKDDFAKMITNQAITITEIGFDESLLEIHIFKLQDVNDHIGIINIDNSTLSLNNNNLTPKEIDFFSELAGQIFSNFADYKLNQALMESITKITKNVGNAACFKMPTSGKEKKEGIDGLIEKINTETKATVTKPKEQLDDYVCNDILKNELQEIIDFFEKEETFINKGIELPKGILFKGPPGTGKTYAAKCIAGTANCYFMHTTASALQGSFIGSGAANIRDVFLAAKALRDETNQGVFLFIDEIDSLGNRLDSHSGSDESNRTLNQLLAELSGFDDERKIIVLAATNYPDRLDEALLRSGRFGRQITINYPDNQERLNLVKYYFDKIKLPITGTTESQIAALSEGMSPADIKEISNEAGILAIRNGASELSLEFINESINRVITKEIKNPDNLENLELITAHECGHVLAEYLYNKTIPIKVTNYSYGNAGGFTQSGNNYHGIMTKEQFVNRVLTLLGGRAAEYVYCGYITNGASNDLEKAKKIIYDFYKSYVFTNYNVEKLEQTIIDDLDTYLKILIDKFSEPDIFDILKKMVDELKIKRVLYKKDLFNLLGVGNE